VNTASWPPGLAPPTAHLWLPQTAEIRAIRAEGEGVTTYDLAFRDPGLASSYRFAPGQFNMLYVPGAGEAAISHSGDPARPEVLTHTIRMAGNVTRLIGGMTVGGTLGVRGPFGSAWPVEPSRGRDLVLVAGGIGLPPLRPVIYEVLNRRGDFGRLHLLYGARSPEGLLYLDEFSAWERRGLTIQTTVDRSRPGWTGNVGVVSLLLDRLRSFDSRRAMLMVCGPEVMMRYTARTAIARGVDPQRIWVSMERNMQCAVGHCGHCQLGPEFICKDGPVFRYDQIVPWMDVEGF
jgi:NAD(P)H-flavin reductase